jgi:hypothetical protein
MDKAVEHVERIFGLFFSSHLTLSRTGFGEPGGCSDSGGREIDFHGYHEAEGHSSICL